MRLLSLALLLAFAPSASAQIIPSIDLGVAGGVNFSSLGDAAERELDSSTGFHAGVFADVSALFFSARTGIFYQRIGDIPGAGEGLEDGTVQFLTVPVDFLIQSPTPVAKVYGLVGPEFRFPLGDLNFGTLGATEKVDVNTAVNVGVGAKAGIPITGPNGFIELRYAYDLTGIADTDSDQDYKVNVVMLRVGVGI